jgi:hypothetical protein
MYVQPDTGARSRNHSFNKNATVSYVCIVELYVTVNNIELLRVAQQCFYGEFMLPATIQRTEVLM